MNPVSHIQNPVRCWTVVISSYTGRLSDQIGIEGEVLTVVPEADLLDAQSTILELEKQVSRYQTRLTDQNREAHARAAMAYEDASRIVYLKAALEKAQVGLEEKDTVIADLRSRIDAAASKLDGALDDLAGPSDNTGYAVTDLGRAYIEGTIPAADLDALYAKLTRDTTPVMEVGGAYKTRGGDIGIVVNNDYDDVYPFDVGSSSRKWSVTRSGTEFYHEGSSGDLVQRIPFPESRLPNPPEGFVYAGYGPLPDASSLGDLALWSPARSLWDSDLCWTGDADGRQYAVRIGSPVHFALASKFAAV